MGSSLGTSYKIVYLRFTNYNHLIKQSEYYTSSGCEIKHFTTTCVKSASIFDSSYKIMNTMILKCSNDQLNRAEKKIPPDFQNVDAEGNKILRF